jgi:hypothetical protein
MMKTHAFLFALLVPATASANEVYMAAKAQGGNTGVDCADAVAYDDATHGFNVADNWTSSTPSGLQIGPGSVVHLCGTITAGAGASGLLSFQGSGTSGNPITLTFETGALLTAPYWGNNGAIDLGDHDNVIVSGGPACGNVNYTETSCNGTIEATDNGTGLTHQNGGVGLQVGDGTRSGDNVTVEYLNVKNMYVHQASDTITKCSWSSGTATCTLTSDWACRVGNTISINLVAPAGYNSASAAITGCPAASQVQFAVASDPGAYVQYGFIAVTQSWTTLPSGDNNSTFSGLVIARGTSPDPICSSLMQVDPFSSAKE